MKPGRLRPFLTLLWRGIGLECGCSTNITPLTLQIGIWINLNEIKVEIWVNSRCVLFKFRCKGLKNNVWNLISIGSLAPEAHFRPLFCFVWRGNNFKMKQGFGLLNLRASWQWKELFLTAAEDEWKQLLQRRMRLSRFPAGGGERFGPLGSSRAAGMERHALGETLGNFCRNYVTFCSDSEPVCERIVNLEWPLVPVGFLCPWLFRTCWCAGVVHEVFSGRFQNICWVSFTEDAAVIQTEIIQKIKPDCEHLMFVLMLCRRAEFWLRS